MLNNEIRKHLFVTFFEEEKGWYFFEPEHLGYILDTYFGNSPAEKLFNALIAGEEIMMYMFESEDKIGKVNFKNLQAMETLFAAKFKSAMQAIILNNWTVQEASLWFQFVSFGDIIEE
jgi:hypothetical protein